MCIRDRYKEAGYRFRYTFFSTKQPRQLILDYVFTPEQYNAKE